MGFFPASDRRAIFDKAMAEQANPTTPLGFFEGVGAVAEDVGLTGRTDSMATQMQSDLSRSLARARDVGLQPPDFPSWTWSNRQVEAASSWLDGQKDSIAALRSPDLEGPPDPLRTGSEIRQSATERAAEVRARAARAGLGASLVGGLAGQATDPLNLALLPLGVFRGETLVAKALIEAGIGAVSGAGIEVGSLAAKENVGLAPTAGEAFTNIAANALLGGAVGAAFHGAGLLARRSEMLAKYRAEVFAGRINPTREMEAAVNAIQDAIDTTPPLHSAAAEAAHLQASAAATDALRAGHPAEQAAALDRVGERGTSWLHATVVNETEAAARVDALETAIRKAPSPPPVVERLPDGARITVGDQSFTVADAALAREKWTIPKIQKALGDQLAQATAEREAAVAHVESAWQKTSRLVGDDFGRSDATPFRTPAQATAAREALGDASLQVVKVGKKEFVLRSPNRVERDVVDAAVTAERANPTPPMPPERPITEPPAVPMDTPAEKQAREAFNTHVAANPDTVVTVHIDGEAVTGNAAEIMAGLDRELAELTDSANCLTGVVVEGV